MSRNRLTTDAIPGPVVCLNVGCHRCGKRLLTTDDDGKQFAQNDATFIKIESHCGAYCGECYLWFLSTLGAAGTIEGVNHDEC